MCDCFSCSILSRSNSNKLTLRYYILQNRCSYAAHSSPDNFHILLHKVYFVSEKPLTLSMGSASAKDERNSEQTHGSSGVVLQNMK